MLTIVRDEKFTLHLENESKAKTLGTEYGTLTEDGVKYYYGAIAVEAIKYDARKMKDIARINNIAIIV